MTRKEQIEKVANEYEPRGYANDYRFAFIAGAEWADQNPLSILSDMELQSSQDLEIRQLQSALDVAVKALELSGGQLGIPNINDACALACKTISVALAEIRELKGDG